jgi:hypothetical protein
MQEKQLPAGDSFWGTSQRIVTLSSGRTVFLPCHFYNVHYLVALFRVRKGLLNPSLAGTGLKPGLTWRGDEVLAMGLVQYSRSDLGAYNEIIFSVPSVPVSEPVSIFNWTDLFGSLQKRTLGQYIFHIPVTSEFSREAGMELWGYPKRLMGIEHTFTPGNIHTVMKDAEGRVVMSVQGSLGFSIPSVPLSLLTYSFRDGKMLRTSVRVRGAMRYYPFRKIVLQAGESDDLIARDIRRLGLDGASPFIVMDSPSFQAKFMEGEANTQAEG